ncbi:Rv3235 family protein [Kitasatospora sp. NBC_01250]|uniref:Rv3235 family protein n=1 Tax=unclassified Kitasatospora TaxID=2633591 RepID=UPI002E0EAB05|nr:MULTISPECIES: Rv3235 family protein [unclassified Kitasatospora]WSJ67494.1 Rv3235 family protein [Kitasatospora sp. NBC_01302]
MAETALHPAATAPAIHRLARRPGTAGRPAAGHLATAHRTTGQHSAAQHSAGHHASAQRGPRHPRAACGGGLGEVDGGLAARFALRLVEVLAGARPVGQLARHTTHDGYRQLARLAQDGPLRRAAAQVRPRLGRVHSSAPGPGALEVCVRVEAGARHRVVAFRLERHWRTAQWQCAAVEAR